MVRMEWLSLNGLWDYSVVTREAQQPDSYQGEILVPFPIEAPLSGVGRMINTFPGRTYPNSQLWYRRTFQRPAEWKGRRTLLHFGAVDWEATVFLNGKELGVHRGGYDAFSFDVTEALKKEGPDELVVAVWDPTFGGGYPRGKQIDRPGGIFYTPSTGIWQTVWLEPVPEVSIAALQLTPDIDAGKLHVKVTLRGKVDGVRLSAVAYDRDLPRVLSYGQTLPPQAGQEVGADIGQVPGKDLDIPVLSHKLSHKLWSPDHPFLYDLAVFLSRDGKDIDSVTSYFGMRKVSVGPDKEGITRILLNNKFVLHNGVLDQGYWPDGIYTAPSDAALRFDIETIKQLGFNLCRKHMKVEPERWYYWADKLGLLVWQDMPASGDGIHAKPPAYPASTAQRQEQFGVELRAMIAGRFNHPSIVSWIVFNEGMGLQNSQGYKLDDNIRAFMAAWPTLPARTRRGRSMRRAVRRGANTRAGTPWTSASGRSWTPTATAPRDASCPPSNEPA